MPCHIDYTCIQYHASVVVTMVTDFLPSLLSHVEGLQFIIRTGTMATKFAHLFFFFFFCLQFHCFLNAKNTFMLQDK